MTFSRFLIPDFAVFNLQVLAIVNFLGFSYYFVAPVLMLTRKYILHFLKFPTSNFSAPYVMPESFQYESNPSPKNGYHFATLMNGYSNGFNSGATLNGYRAEYNLNTTCNGFYSTLKNDTRPEKTVGHGRPKMPSQSSRIRSFSDSSSSNHYRAIYSRKVGCCFVGLRL